MKIYISKHGNEIFLSDLAIQSDGEKLLTVGFPHFRFNLTKGEELENSILEFLQSSGIEENGCYKMELRRWPEG